jgi:glycosidase
VPLIYSGQEIPNRERLPFFHHHSLNWPSVPQLHDFYKGLAELRHTHPALGSNDNSSFVPLQLLNDNILAFHRQSGEDQIVVLLNFSHESIAAALPHDWPDGEFRDHFTDESFVLAPGQEIKVKGAAAMVLIKKAPRNREPLFD